MRKLLLIGVATALMLGSVSVWAGTSGTPAGENSATFVISNGL